MVAVGTHGYVFRVVRDLAFAKLSLHIQTPSTNSQRQSVTARVSDGRNLSLRLRLLTSAVEYRPMRVKGYTVSTFRVLDARV